MSRIKILSAIIAFAIAMVVIAPIIVNPFLKKKILSTLNQKYPDYEINIDKVRWWLVPSKLTIKEISVRYKALPDNRRYLKGEISAVQFKGIKNIKALFRREYEIRDIVIDSCNIQGTVPFHKKEKLPVTSTLNIKIDQIAFEHINLSLKDSSTAQSLIIEEGMLRLTDLEIKKKDTLGIFHHFDLKAKTIASNAPDSLYTYHADGVVYSDSLKLLAIDSMSMDPNYKRYDFTSRFPYETDRFVVNLSDLKLYHFKGDDFYNSGHLKSSCLSIGRMDLEAFRDKREKDSDENKAAFQKYLYDYPGLLKIDSLLFNDGTITYIEHADHASEPGRVHLSAFKAKAYNITNDTLYKTKDSSLTIIAEALLMGKSKMNVHLKARLFDPANTFSMNGSLAEMEVKELNPILEKNAFLYANTAKINKLKFNFTANDTKASGELILLYEGLDLSIKNKRTEDTTGIKEQFISLIANKTTWDSNPLPKEEARVGIIDYERDPTKFIINYCLKSIVSGVKSTVIKQPKKKKSFFQKIFTNRENQKKNVLPN